MVIVAGRLPVLVSWMVLVACVPTGTEPKSMELGLGVSWLLSACPVPERPTVSVVLSPASITIWEESVVAPAGA